MPDMQPDPETHKRQVTGLFDLIAEGYDSPSQRFVARCTDRPVERLRPARDADVLDIPTGTDVAAIGAEGRVQAIDLSEAIETVEEQHGHHLADVNGWWEPLWNSGFRGYLNALTPEQLEAFRTPHLARVAELVTEQGLWLDIATLFTTARRPAASA